MVALGEGLETQFWRVDNGRVRWLTVDCPRSSISGVASFQKSRGPRDRLLRLDPRWLAEVQDEAVCRHRPGAADVPGS